ncbi:yellow-f [Halictus rubicundus]|uniref:yellow-f n=1 Tax=Halictus rubicundus TaxID=77578 RepID=UPI004035435E
MRCLLLLALLAVASCHDFETLYTWNMVDFNLPDDSIKKELVSKGEYIPENNMPLGMHVWEDKIFITIPRWKKGVVANLNVFSKDDKSQSPTLTPYPNWEANDIHKPGSIVSIFRVRSDACGRLWGVDTGIDDILGNSTVVDGPRLFVIDLKTDEILRVYPLKDSDQTANSFFADLVVDSDENNCEDTHVYISDLSGYGLVVYSWAKNDSWRVSHNYFHFDPLHGNFNVSGYNFQWTDGVFGLSLSPKGSDGHRTLYFHAMSGITEFSVPTEVLQDNESKKYEDYYAFKNEGTKGPNTQGPSSVIDQNTGINYLTQVSKNGVACWDTSVALNPDTFVPVAQDNTTLVFPNDISIDEAQNKLYVLSDNLPQLMFSHFDAKERNFFLTAAPLDKLTALCKKCK